MKISEKDEKLGYSLNDALVRAHGKWADKEKESGDNFGETCEIFGIITYVSNFLLTGVVKAGWEKDILHRFYHDLKESFEESYEEALESQKYYSKKADVLNDTAQKLVELLDELKEKIKEASHE